MNVSSKNLVGTEIDRGGANFRLEIFYESSVRGGGVGSILILCMRLG